VHLTARHSAGDALIDVGTRAFLRLDPTYAVVFSG
jgi:hypothetical protein